MQRTGAHLHFEFATDFALYYSHACHSPACLQWRQDPPQMRHRQEQTRRCGVASQRWRARIIHCKDTINFHATAHVYAISNNSNCRSCDIDVHDDDCDRKWDDGDGNRSCKGSRELCENNPGVRDTEVFSLRGPRFWMKPVHNRINFDSSFLKFDSSVVSLSWCVRIWTVF